MASILNAEDARCHDATDEERQLARKAREDGERRIDDARNRVTRRSFKAVARNQPR